MAISQMIYLNLSSVSEIIVHAENIMKFLHYKKSYVNVKHRMVLWIPYCLY